ncbi:hypothetical protein B0A49_05673 [Cryomyces minteri]|uniref:Uncharacterized protein n=1 Tax=Cryomyces minteri TaxID=331657 RepID=A0A4U0WZ68_9PEZI|nr:hypothetical protein B0A49_05673 [Cryomyces minteri]
MAHLLPGLSVTVPDDSMEISSDYGRADDDIEIDIDITGAQDNERDDDYMLEDANPEIDLTSHQHDVEYTNDDVMLDEDVFAEEDGDMQDDITVPDEELRDASEIGQYSVAPTPKQSELETQAHDEFAHPEDHYAANEVDEEISHVPEEHHEYQDEIYYNDDVAQSSETAPVAEGLEGTAQHDGNAFVNAEQGVHQADDHDCQKSLAENAVHAASIDENTNTAAAEAPQDKSIDESTENTADVINGEQRQFSDVIKSPADSGDALVKEQRASSYEDAENGHTEDVHHDGESHSPIVTALHPTTVMYQGDEMSLFPSRAQKSSEMYLLQDENLVNGSIGDLLQACRSVLDKDVSDDDELVIEVAELGLYISEDSLHAFQTSFSQILDVYVQLCRQEASQTPDPLYVTLGTRPRFSRRLQHLSQAASEGKGLSEVPFLIEIGEELGIEEELPEDVVDGDTADAATHNLHESEHMLADLDNKPNDEIVLHQDPQAGEHERVTTTSNEASVAQQRSGSRSAEERDMAPVHENFADTVETPDKAAEGRATGPADNLDQIHGDDLVDDEIEGEDGNEKHSSGSSTIRGDYDPNEDEPDVQDTADSYETNTDHPFDQYTAENDDRPTGVQSHQQVLYPDDAEAGETAEGHDNDDPEVETEIPEGSVTGAEGVSDEIGHLPQDNADTIEDDGYGNDPALSLHGQSRSISPHGVQSERKAHGDVGQLAQAHNLGVDQPSDLELASEDRIDFAGDDGEDMAANENANTNSAYKDAGGQPGALDIEHADTIGLATDKHEVVEDNDPDEIDFSDEGDDDSHTHPYIEAADVKAESTRTSPPIKRTWDEHQGNGGDEDRKPEVKKARAH